MVHCISRRSAGLFFALLCSLSFVDPSAAQNRGSIDADRITFSGDTSSFIDTTFIPVADGTLYFDSSSRNFVFHFHGRRWLLPDSLHRDIAAFIDSLSDAFGGRTYVSDRHDVRHGNLGTIDSTSPGLYIIDYNFGTLNYQGYTNFSNNIGVGTSDSAQFQINGLGLNGFMLPTDWAYGAWFDRAVVKTSYGAVLDASYELTFPDNITHSADSTLFSVHIKTEYIAGVRNYYLRIYKVNKYTAGLSIPLTAGALVASHPLPTNRFPPYGSSVQLRLELWIRRI